LLAVPNTPKKETERADTHRMLFHGLNQLIPVCSYWQLSEGTRTERVCLQAMFEGKPVFFMSVMLFNNFCISNQIKEKH